MRRQHRLTEGQKPLFAHYAYSDMKEVQPYKSLAQREIHEKDPSRYKDYAKAIEITNAMQDMERREGYQRQAERTREPSQDKGIGQVTNALAVVGSELARTSGKSLAWSWLTLDLKVI